MRDAWGGGRQTWLLAGMMMAVCVHVQTGQLPEEMVPDDNDGLEGMSGDDEPDTTQAAHELQSVTLPMRLGALQGSASQPCVHGMSGWVAYVF